MALAPDDIARRTFTIGELGYERGEVQAFLAEVAGVVGSVQLLADHHIRRAARAEAEAHLRIEALRRLLVDALATIDGTGAVLDLTGDSPVMRTAVAPAPGADAGQDAGPAPGTDGGPEAAPDAAFGDGPLADRAGVDPVDDLVRRAVALAADAARIGGAVGVDGDEARGRAGGVQLAGSATPSVH